MSELAVPIRVNTYRRAQARVAIAHALKGSQHGEGAGVLLGLVLEASAMMAALHRTQHSLDLARDLYGALNTVASRQPTPRDYAEMGRSLMCLGQYISDGALHVIDHG